MLSLRYTAQIGTRELDELTQTSNPKLKLVVFGVHCAVVVWLVGFQFFLLKLAWQGHLLHWLDGGTIHFIDFPILYNDGLIASSPQRHLLYDPAVQLSFFNQTFSPQHTEALPFAQHSPLCFLLMVAFAQMPINCAFVVWNVVTNSVAALAIWRLMLQRLPNAQTGHIWLLLSILATYPFLANERGGQAGALMAALTAFFCLMWMRKSDALAGVFLALLTIKPQYVIHFAVLALAARRWKLLLSAALTFGVLLGLCIAYFGWSAIVSYANVVLHVESHANNNFVGVFPIWMVSIRGLLSLLLPERIAFQITALLFGLSLLPTFYLGMRSRLAGAELNRWALALVIIIMFIVSPHSMDYDVSVVGCAAVLTIPATISLSEMMAAQTSLKVWYFTFASYPLLGMVLFCLLQLIPLGQIVGVTALMGNLILLAAGVCRLASLDKAELREETELLAN